MWMICPDASPLSFGHAVARFSINGGWGTGGWKAAGLGHAFRRPRRAREVRNACRALHAGGFSSRRAVAEHAPLRVVH